ncbi:MAG TPA: FKBP-type peptidyl-prolyl cis-trans isomerase [Candidatus Nanoarchaeia archaeon]|nr:FKBP-type peptidyl-prolyl cis-trans isomerase [Candidatus Nanoarchaeia archaeon]
MVNVKKGQFLEIEYTGLIKGSDIVFDRSNIEDKKGVIICLGGNSLLPGLETKLEDKEVNKEYNLDLNLDEAFGKKDPKLIKIIQTKVFISKKINPIPGLQVNVDGALATIRSVSGGRCVVDFNHPLAGRNLTYNIKIIRIINDNKEKVESILNLDFPFIKDFNLENENLTLFFEKFDNKIKELIVKRFKELLPEIKNINFEDSKEKKVVSKE